MRVPCEVFDAVRVTVDLGSDIDEYAKNFLSIFNNVRENQELYSVHNQSGSNRVSVTCDPDYVEETKNWLGYFGEVDEGTKLIRCLRVDDGTDYDLDKYWESMVIQESY